MVTEGRDQGTLVFPDAFRKYYLTASDEERARRRVARTRRPEVKQRALSPCCTINASATRATQPV